MRRSFALLTTLLVSTPVAAPSQSPGALTVDARAAGPGFLVAAARRLPALSLHLDGSLDDEAWRAATPTSGFVQIEPRHGLPASLDTEVRVLQDDTHVYLAMRAHDPSGREGIRVRDLRRDFAWGRSDAMGVVFDGFGDGRTILAFAATPFGAQWDAQATDGGLSDLDWDAPWRVRTNIDADGWSAEFAIPWSVLRYAPGLARWRVNFVREVPRLGESSSLSAYPRAMGPFRMEFGGTVDSLAAPGTGARLLLQPYVVGRRPTIGEGDAGASLGGEVKWQPTARTTVDVTLNTDFAQADVDRQVVNLTRFTPFFPERRPFFLENRGLFTIGAPERLLPFFTRSVGLTASGTPLPIDAGVRVIHRGGAWSGAGLFLRQGGDGVTPAASIAVVRGQRRVGSRARIGALLVERIDGQAAGVAARTGTTLALDAFARPRPSVTMNAMVTGTTRGGNGGEGLAAWGEVQRTTSSLLASATAEYVGRDYTPGAGFVARGDVVRASARLTGDWRPARRPAAVRAFRPSLSPTAVWRASDRRLQEAQITLRALGVDYVSGARLWLDVTGDRQELDRPFELLPGVRVPVGSYTTTRVDAEFQSSSARPLAVTIGGGAGSYFDGHILRTSTRLAWTPRPQVVLDASHSLAALRHVGGGAGTRVTHLLAPELRLAASPRLQLAVFYQHNTAARVGALNARFVWEYRPLSTLALVYNGRAPLAGARGESAPAPARAGELVLKLGWTGWP